MTPHCSLHAEAELPLHITLLYMRSFCLNIVSASADDKMAAVCLLPFYLLAATCSLQLGKSVFNEGTEVRNPRR